MFRLTFSFFLSLSIHHSFSLPHPLSLLLPHSSSHHSLSHLFPSLSHTSFSFILLPIILSIPSFPFFFFLSFPSLFLFHPLFLSRSHSLPLSPSISSSITISLSNICTQAQTDTFLLNSICLSRFILFSLSPAQLGQVATTSSLRSTSVVLSSVVRRPSTVVHRRISPFFLSFILLHLFIFYSMT